MILDLLFELTMVYSLSLEEKLRRFFGYMGTIVSLKDVRVKKNSPYEE